MSSPLKRKLKCKEDEDKKLIEPIVEIASTSTRKKETTMAKRLEILQKLEKGVTIDKVAAEYGLHRRTIQRYLKNIESIREVTKNPRCLVMKRNRIPMHQDTNARLLEWILERQMKGDVFNDNVLQEKAKEFHKKFGGSTNFTASRGWLWRFKKRYNICASGIHEIQTNANELIREKLEKILNEENIDKQNVYNIHETSLMWRILPQTIFSVEELVQNEKMKPDYVTIAFCANVTGTHKLPLLFINKYATPQALKHCKHTLPVTYMNQNNGIIDEVVFNDWYSNHFKCSVSQHQQQKHHVGKVLLIVHNFKGDIPFEKIQEDSYFKLMALPPDTSSLIQPLDEGITTKCKKLFRQKLLHRVYQHAGGVRKFLAEYDIKDCIDLISESWSDVTTTEIILYWKKLLGQQDFETVVKKEPIQPEENITSEEISEWISKCEEEELTVEEITKQEETNANHHCSIEKEEIDRMFHNLEIWAETQPDFIKLYAKVLIHYHNQQ